MSPFGWEDVNITTIMCIQVFHNELTSFVKFGVNPIGTGGVVPKYLSYYVIIQKLRFKTNRSLSYSKINPGYKFSAFWDLYSFQLILDKQTYNIVFYYIDYTNP